MRKGNNSRREKKCQPMRLNWSSQKRQQLSCTEQKLQEMRSYRPFHSFLPNECKYRKSPGGKQHTEETDVFIDSGATCNIVNRTSWENLRQRGVKCESCNCQEKLFAYGKTKPIEGTFQSEIYCEESGGRCNVAANTQCSLDFAVYC